jgi:hypothetical protein
MPLGFLVVSAGILVIMYTANKKAEDEWLMWGIISLTVINAGLAILGNAVVHKVKSDLIQKNRSKRSSHRSSDEE